ncbi:hypothetical protein [Stieleria varia]|nr:hypothetical protein [Stieleria varia]
MAKVPVHAAGDIAESGGEALCVAGGRGIVCCCDIVAVLAQWMED